MKTLNICENKFSYKNLVSRIRKTRIEIYLKANLKVENPNSIGKEKKLVIIDRKTSKMQNSLEHILLRYK